MKKVINFLKEVVVRGRPVFLVMFIIFTVHIRMLVSIGWGGWVLYLATLAVTVTGCYLQKGCQADVIGILKVLHPKIAAVFRKLTARRKIGGKKPTSKKRRHRR